MKKLPFGSLSFTKLRKDDKYYVDKSPFIKTVFEDDADVLLITRPRRFGKTLFMDAMAAFFAINTQNPNDTSDNEELFAGLRILEDKDFCHAHMGQYPVISLSLKDVKDNDFLGAYSSLSSCILENAQSFSFLLDSPRLNEHEKERLSQYQSEKYLPDANNKSRIKTYLKDIISYLSKHYEKEVVVFIDEYDVPLATAAKNGYYEQMLPLIQGFLSEALKPNSANARYLKKAVLTGCLRVGKQSIFTDFNNPDVNTVCSANPALSEAIGFTASEVQELLHYYGLESYFHEIKRWYDGYRFADSEIYCPWDLVNFCSNAIKLGKPKNLQPGNYWIATSESEVIEDFLGYLSGKEAEQMQILVDGGEIEVTVNETLNYNDLKKHDSQDFWTLLLFTGYLTIAERLPQSALSFKLRIPNEEVRDTFIKKVQARFSATNSTFANRGLEFVRATFAGDVDKITEALSSVLDGYVSIRDTATKAPRENYYLGMLNALCACGSGVLEFFNSNAESGNGYADIVFTDNTSSSRTGVVIEIKYAPKQEELYEAAQGALNQIKEKNYGAYLGKFHCKNRANA